MLFAYQILGLAAGICATVGIFSLMMALAIYLENKAKAVLLKVIRENNP